MTWGIAEPGFAALSLRTPRLLLRTWRPEDRDEFVRLSRVSAEFWRPWMPAVAPTDSLDVQFDRSLAVCERGLASGTHLRLVGELEGGRLAGFFSLGEIVWGVFRSAYAGWRVGADVAGQGLATEAVTGILDLAFAPRPHGLGLHRVQANVIPTNAPSLRVAEKCAFRREGLALRYLKIAGTWQDHVMFAKTVEEHQLVYLTA
jgi:ribosomal-protein-alanine N-acetyltransferase